jgi:hypothetical protein
MEFIHQHRSPLLRNDGMCRAEIAQLIRTVEWELLGVAKFMEYHLSDREGEGFVQHMLASRPGDFTRDDLRSLIMIKRFPSWHPLHDAASKLLAKHVASFADRISSEPPGMSEDVQSLRQSIAGYRFSPALNEILHKIDSDIQEANDGFDQASTMRHIRSFFREASRERRLRTATAQAGCQGRHRP